MGGVLLKGVDEWEERDDYSFRVTLVCVYERERGRVSLTSLLYLCTF